MTEYRRQFGSIVHMYQACMHVGKRSALVRSKDTHHFLKK